MLSGVLCAAREKYRVGEGLEMGKDSASGTVRSGSLHAPWHKTGLLLSRAVEGVLRVVETGSLPHVVCSSWEKPGWSDSRFNLTQVKMCQFLRQMSPAVQLGARSADGVGVGSRASEVFGGQTSACSVFSVPAGTKQAYPCLRLS